MYTKKYDSLKYKYQRLLISIFYFSLIFVLSIILVVYYYLVILEIFLDFLIGISVIIGNGSILFTYRHIFRSYGLNIL